MAIAKILPARPAATTEEADTVLELAYLMTAVDGRLADEELPAYREVASWIRGEAVSDADFGLLLERFSSNLEKGAIEERVRVVAPKVPPQLKEVAFKVAIGLALVDQEASPEEDALMGILFEGLGLDGERAEVLAEEVRRAFA
jgi:tellurite resistance protein